MSLFSSSGNIFQLRFASSGNGRLRGFASTPWIGATGALANRSQVKTHSAERSIRVQQQVNEAARKAGMGGIMGFLWVGL